MQFSELIGRATEAFCHLGIELTVDTKFVEDIRVDYGMTTIIGIRRSDLFTVDDTTRFRAVIPEDAAWVHFNGLCPAEGPLVVSVRAGGTRASSQTPVVNVSMEGRPVRVENE